MTQRGTSAGDGSGPKTRYHLLTTDGGILADQPGKMAGEAAIGVVLKAPLEEIAERNGKSQVKAEHLKPLYDQAVSLIHQFADIKIGWVPREANAEADALVSTPLGPLRAKPKPSIDELPLESAPEETETEPEKPRKAKKSREWKSLPPAEMAEHLLSHQTLADCTWTDELRQKGEKREAFIRRILLGETGETG